MLVTIKLLGPSGTGTVLTNEVQGENLASEVDALIKRIFGGDTYFLPSLSGNRHYPVHGVIYAQPSAKMVELGYTTPTVVHHAVITVTKN